MEVTLDHGAGRRRVRVPDDATLVTPALATEPPPLPDPASATLQAIREPLGHPPLGEVVGPGSTVTLAFPDRVKGGTHLEAHRRIAVPALLDELAHAGVRPRDIRLVCAMGLHRKNRPEEIAQLLGAAVPDRVGTDRIVNHDAEDPGGIVDLGPSALGDPVQANRAAVEADLTILVGHAAGNPYGGYSGGYKMPATGLTTWRSIAAHHTPRSLYRDDFVPASTRSRFRHQLRAIGERMESAAPRPFFAVDEAIDSASRQLGVWAGAIGAVEEASWPVAARRTEVVVGDEPYDVLLLGIPRDFHYGPGMGTNPLLLMQAIGAGVIRASAALVARPVVIAAAACDGWFNDVDFPSYRRTFELLEACHHPADMTRYEEEVCTDPEWIRRYRHEWAYHPFHAFSMVYLGGVARERTTAVFVAGAGRPGHARAMGARSSASVEEALRETAALLSRQPRVLVVPTLGAPQFHLRLG